MPNLYNIDSNIQISYITITIFSQYITHTCKTTTVKNNRQTSKTSLGPKSYHSSVMLVIKYVREDMFEVCNEKKNSYRTYLFFTDATEMNLNYDSD